MALSHNLQTVSSDSEMNKEATKAELFAAANELQSIENVFVGVEQSQMIISPIYYPATELQKIIADLRNGSAQSFTNETKTNLFNDLNLWRNSLIERDQKFSAFDLRSFCSNAQPQFDNSIYAALAGFYRKLPHSASVLSKFDYVITQFFSRQLENNRRALRLETKRLVEDLRHLNAEWMGEELDASLIKSQVHKSLVALSTLSTKAKSHQRLGSWIEDEFFDYSREVKRGLSETFFVPEITAAVVICNLVVGNHFAALCEADNAILTDSSKDLNNTSETQNPTPFNSSFQTLFYTGLEEDFSETLEQERLSNFYNLKSDDKLTNEILDEQAPPVETGSDKNEAAEVIIEKTLLGENEAENSDDYSKVSEDLLAVQDSQVSGSTSQSAILLESSDNADLIPNAAVNSEAGSKDETEIRSEDQTLQSVKKTSSKIADVLSELANPAPNRELIKNYLQKSTSPKIKELRFDDFLDSDQSSENKNLSEMLGLILRAEELMRVIIGAEGNLSAKFKEEVNLLLEEIQTASNNSRRLMSETVSARNEDKSPQKYFETLLYATNILVETQLRLGSSVVHRKNTEKKPFFLKKQSPQLAAEPDSIVYDNDTAKNNPADFSYKNIGQILPAIKISPNKWLMIAGIVVVLLGASWFTLYSLSGQAPVASANVQALDPKLMLGGAGLIKAKVGSNTLFGFVNSDWTAQSQQQKKDNLRLLLEEGSKYNYDKVLLVNQNGQFVADANKNEIKIQ